MPRHTNMNREIRRAGLILALALVGIVPASSALATVPGSVTAHLLPEDRAALDSDRPSSSVYPGGDFTVSAPEPTVQEVIRSMSIHLGPGDRATLSKTPLTVQIDPSDTTDLFLVGPRVV